MVFGSKIIGEVKEYAHLVKDILRGANKTVWGGAQGMDKSERIVKTGLSGADIIIGTSHVLEDFSCGDPICGTIDIVGNISSSIGLVLGNIESTKDLTFITGSITVCCRSVRWYCRKYGTFWGCTVAAGQGIKEAIKFTVKP